ncbi:MAG: hypothetical protein K6G48_04855 [Acholeplasmatales bacterium]|nr:hypothetical protein [Acholeplasmatales bacterium]
MEQENKYTSVFMYQDVSKPDFVEFKKTYSYKADKKDILFYLSFPIMILGVILLFFTAGGVLLVLAGIALLAWRLGKINSKKDLDFLDKYEKYLLENAKKYEGAISNSAIYPTYYFVDNKAKRFRFMYQDKVYVDIPYDDIVSFDILNDKTISQYKRLPDQPNPTIRSYILRVNCKGGRSIEIGYSNTNKLIKLRNSFVYQQFANTISINKLCALFERIILKNRA